VPTITPPPPKSGQRGRVRIGGTTGTLLPGRDWTFTEGADKFDGSAFGSQGKEIGYGLPGCTGNITVVSKGGLNLTTAGIHAGGYIQMELFEDNTEGLSHQFPWVGIDSVQVAGTVNGGYTYTITWSSHGTYTLNGTTTTEPA
jgi:hypothetical protein